MSHDFCPRQISFVLPGAPGVQITATEVNGTIEFSVDVLDSGTSGGDLRGLFFHIDETELAGLTVTSGSPYLTQAVVGDDNVINLRGGANMSGAVKSGFDVGLEWGTPGRKDVVDFPVSFTLSNPAGTLTLDDLGGMLFGARLGPNGGAGGGAGGSKLLTVAPFAPDAVNDVISIFEDGAADSNSPSKTPTAVALNLLANDTDADVPAQSLTITGIHDGPLNGTVTISADGKTVYYTPNADFSGTDSFLYCISDGNGGQDSALCTINVAAVADDPVITMTVSQGASINETIVTVTATQDDADGSEDISSLNWAVQGGVPAGVTITPAGPILPGAGANVVTQQFLVTTAAQTDWDFDVDFTAVSTEASNGDSEASSAAQSIEINYTHSAGTLTYTVTDQNIWDTGDAFFFDISGDEGFVGINIPYTSGGDVLEDPIFGADIAGYNYEYQLKAGFQLDVHIEGGSIDATVPIDVTIDSTYNKTTDTIYLDTSALLGSGGSFLTSGPEGSLSLDFIFNYLASASAFGGPLSVGIGPFSGNYDTNIIDLNTNDSRFDWDVLPGVVTVGVEWPHISVANDPGLLSGSGLSNYFLYAELDVDGLANYLLGGALSWIDADPTTEDNFEVLDLDIVGGLKLLQEFGIDVSGNTVTLVLEDGTTVPLTLGEALTIENASSHDSNQDGNVSFSFDLDPNVQLTNTTSINVGVEAELAFIRNLDLAVTDFTAYNESFPIFDLPIAIYGNTFALEGVGSQTFNFIA